LSIRGRIHGDYRGVVLAGKKIDPARLELVKYPDPRLRRKCVEVKEFDDWLRQVAQRMFDIMYASKGIGLAGPQVGLGIRIFVCDPAGKPSGSPGMAFVNPVLSDLVGAEESEEGCLSLPGVYGQVLRPAKCRIRAYDVNGNPIDRQGEDMPARIWQHEVDHLEGVLHIDRFGEAARLACRRSLREMEESYQAKGRKKSLVR
jgi:peptide deformylase